MTELSLEWIEAGRLRTQRIGPNQATKKAGVIRIGRDPSRCDIVLADGSVSGLHVEIGHDANQEFYIQNLRETNPPIINHEPLLAGRRGLLAENIIQLGNVQIRANKAVTSTPIPEEIPATELQSFSPQAPTQPANPPLAKPSVPQYPPPDSPHYYQPLGQSPSPPAFHPGNSTQSSTQTDNSAWDQDHGAKNSVQPNNGHRKSTQSPLLFLILGALSVGLLLLAWPSIRGFIGIGSSTVESDQSKSPVQDSAIGNKAISIADRELFSHPSGLFDIEVPRDWTEINNSRAGQVLIQAWRHPRVNAYIIMRIFPLAESLSIDELLFQSQQLVDDLFSDLERFQRTEPEALNNGSVRILWEGDQGSDTLVAATYVRQDGLNISALTLWAPAEATQDNVLENDVNEILSSWAVDPNGKIP